MRYTADGISFDSFILVVKAETQKHGLMLGYETGAHYTIHARTWLTLLARTLLREQSGKKVFDVIGSIDCGDGRIYEVEIIPRGAPNGNMAYVTSLVGVLNLSLLKKNLWQHKQNGM